MTELVSSTGGNDSPGSAGREPAPLPAPDKIEPPSHRDSPVKVAASRYRRLWRFSVIVPSLVAIIPLLILTGINHVQFSFDIALLILFGPKALVYLLLSFLFGIGLHPLGARWIQRHYLINGGTQETFSYYGPLNKLAFNVGYHNEHHDMPSVPWNNLPKLRRLAPEAYEDLAYHTSWTKLLFRFLFDREVTLYSRVVRAERGGVKLDDTVKPDIEALEQG